MKSCGLSNPAQPPATIAPREGRWHTNVKESTPCPINQFTRIARPFIRLLAEETDMKHPYVSAAKTTLAVIIIALFGVFVALGLYFVADLIYSIL